MELVRLKVWVRGTAKSKRLDEGEEDFITIPTWIPNPAKGLETINDYVNHVILHAPGETGDLIANACIESTQVPDDMDISPSNPAMQSFMLDESEEVSWNETQNIVITVIQWLMTENEIIFGGDVSTTASQIYEAVSGTSMFGWCNVDPAFAKEIIEMVLNAIYEDIEDA